MTCMTLNPDEGGGVIAAYIRPSMQFRHRNLHQASINIGPVEIICHLGEY